VSLHNPFEEEDGAEVLGVREKRIIIMRKVWREEADGKSQVNGSGGITCGRK